MRITIVKRTVVLSALALVLAASPARALDPVEPVRKTHEVVIDVAVARPLAAVRLLVGGAAFVVAYPLSLVLGGTDHVVDHCVKDPLDDLLLRPLGEL